ncbi:acyl-CoA carboxylase subunit beta [Thermodesulfobacteriota bacterium]
MSWQRELDEFNFIKEQAKKMGGSEGIARQHRRGKLTVRERLDLLVDPGSFEELKVCYGTEEFDEHGNVVSFYPGNTVAGYGNINDRPVCIRGDDFSIMGGSSDPMGRAKDHFIEPRAFDRRVPMIRLLDGAGGSVREVAHGAAQPPRDQRARGAFSDSEFMAHVPLISAVLGSCAGWIAIAAATSTWSIMTKKSSELFVAGPPLIKRALSIDLPKQELGNWKVHVCQTGVINNVGEDEEDVFRQIRDFLSYLPQNVWKLPPHIETDDSPDRRDEEMLSVIPRGRGKTYDIRRLIKHVVDKDSEFEVSPLFGSALVTMLARMDGYPVALMANDCRQEGGAMTADACDKMERFVDLVDTFHLPIIYLVDVPGFMLGPESEKQQTLKKASRANIAVHQATVPFASVITRRFYGVAASGAKRGPGLNVTYGWPSAESGSLPAAGGAMAAYRKEIDAAADPKKKLIEIEDRLNRLSLVAHRPDAVDEVIDPRDTRPILCRFVKEAQEINATQLGPKRRLGLRP